MKFGKIYKIIYIGNENKNICYIGSTFNTLRDRFSKHKYITNTPTCLTPYIKKYGIKLFKILLIKEYEVYDRKHLQSKEQLWINKMNCINKAIAFQPMTKKQLSKIYTINHKKEINLYRINYKEEKKITDNNYYIKNKDKFKEYNIKNKDKIKEYNKEYGQKRVANNQEKYLCECGTTIKLISKSSHLKSKFHKNYYVELKI